METEKKEEFFKGDGYEIIAWANNQEVVYYGKFGGYQGEWILISKDKENYYIYKDYYGSCGGCDAFEAFFGWNKDITKERAKDFVEEYEYKPFLVIPREKMIRLVENRTLIKVFPYNIRGFVIKDEDLELISNDTIVSVKLLENLEITIEDILKCSNQELKQRALKKFGYERFIQETNPEIIDKDGENELLKIEDLVFVLVKDASTDRKYLLRVPPQMKTVKEAIAWTFGKTPEEYNPIIET